MPRGRGTIPPPLYLYYAGRRRDISTIKTIRAPAGAGTRLFFIPWPKRRTKPRRSPQALPSCPPPSPVFLSDPILPGSVPAAGCCPAFSAIIGVLPLEWSFPCYVFLSFVVPVVLCPWCIAILIICTPQENNFAFQIGPAGIGQALPWCRGCVGGAAPPEMPSRWPRMAPRMASSLRDIFPAPLPPCLRPMRPWSPPWASRKTSRRRQLPQPLPPCSQN